MRFGKLFPVLLRHPRPRLTHVRLLSRVAALAFGAIAAACGTPTAADTVDLGDNPEPPDLAIDEDFFHCRIQPEVITQYRCAPGEGDEGGSCHLARSALRLVEVTATPRCQGDRVVGTPSAESQVNLERLRAAIGVDAESSPLYRRPLGLDSHPRVIFAEDSEPADLLRTWLTQGAP